MGLDRIDTVLPAMAATTTIGTGTQKILMMSQCLGGWRLQGVITLACSPDMMGS